MKFISQLTSQLQFSRNPVNFQIITGDYSSDLVSGLDKELVCQCVSKNSDNGTPYMDLLTNGIFRTRPWSS